MLAIPHGLGLSITFQIILWNIIKASKCYQQVRRQQLCSEGFVLQWLSFFFNCSFRLVTVKEEVRKVALYTIFVNPMDTNEFCVGGRDHFVRVYDRRKVSDEREGPLKKFCPHHLLNSETRANVTCCVYSYNGGGILSSKPFLDIDSVPNILD